MNNTLKQTIKKIKKLSNVKFWIIGGIAFLIIINLISVITQSLQPPEVIKLPELDLNTAINQDLIIEFSKFPANISLTAHPAMQFELQIYENTLIAKPKKFYKEATQYQIEIKYKKRTLNSFSFTTKIMDETELIMQTEQESLANAPLINYTPYETEQFYVVYTNDFELTTTIKRGTKTEIEPKIKQWMQNKGVDPTSHKLIFKTTDGTSTNTNGLLPTTNSLKQPTTSSPSRTPEEKTRLFELGE